MKKDKISDRRDFLKTGAAAALAAAAVPMMAVGQIWLEILPTADRARRHNARAKEDLT